MECFDSVNKENSIGEVWGAFWTTFWSSTFGISEIIAAFCLRFWYFWGAFWEGLGAECAGVLAFA